jgi:small conductance mechanosensitive channel
MWPPSRITIIISAALLASAVAGLFISKFITIHHAISPLFSALLAATACFVLYKIRRKVLLFIDKKNRNSGTLIFTLNFIFGALLYILSIPILSELGVPTASLLTILGTSSLAIGLALKGFLSNIAAGIMLILQKPFDVGDLIEVSGTTGYVDKMDLFSVKLRTAAKEYVYIPNGKIASDKVINKNAKQPRRLELTIGVSYESDLKHVKDVINDLISNNDKILKTPEPIVAVNNLSENCIELIIRVWTTTKELSNIKYYLLENIKTTFDEQKIEMPYPQLDIRVKQNL